MVDLIAALKRASRKRDAAERGLERVVLTVAATGVSQRDIAAALGVSQPAVSQMVAASRDRILARTEIGRSVLANRGDLLARSKSHGASRVRVFGSVAAGTAGVKSDLDLLVSLGPESGMLRATELAEDLSDLLGVEVDVIPESFVREDVLPALNEQAIIL